MLSSIRESFCITQEKVLANRVICECAVCQRFKPFRIQPMMRSLPKVRVNPIPPSHITGVDYAGFFRLVRRDRGANTQKCHIALFVLFTIKGASYRMI